VARGAACTISVRFAPSAAGARGAALRLNSDAAGGPQDVALSGTGSFPAVSALGIGDSTLTPGQATGFSFNSAGPGTARLAIEKQVKGLKLKQGRKLSCLASTKRRLRKLRAALAKQKAVKGLRGRARVRKLSKLVRKRACKAFKAIATISRPVTAGPNAIAFEGRLAGRKLAPGRYRARLTVADPVGNVSPPTTVQFRVIAKKQGKRRPR